MVEWINGISHEENAVNDMRYCGEINLHSLIDEDKTCAEQFSFKTIAHSMKIINQADFCVSVGRIKMLSKEQEREEKIKEIVRDIVERAANGEFGWVHGINGGISLEELLKIREDTPPSLRLVNGVYEPIKED